MGFGISGIVDAKQTWGSGIVPLNASGEFQVRITNANAALLALYCIGYIE
jgi:hypothetical protein